MIDRLRRTTIAVAGALVLCTAVSGTAEESGGSPGPVRLDAAGLDAGERFICAITAASGVRCWGEGQTGQLAQGTTDRIGDGPGETTVAVPLPGTAAAISAGTGHACAVGDAGALWCWGANAAGQLAQGHTNNLGDSPTETPVPVQLPAGRSARAASAGGDFTCAVLDDGSLRCWGGNDSGQLAQGDTARIGDDPGESTVTVSLPPGRRAVTVAAGFAHACAILDDGGLRCWGANGAGQLGQGSNNAVGDDTGESTVAVDLGARRAVAVSTGLAHTCAITDDGSLRCWGRNAAGQLGQGHTDDIGDNGSETTAAVPLPPGRSARAISAGSFHTCAILDDGSLRCWGGNSTGQLGQGSIDNIGDDPGEQTAAVDLGPGRTALAVATSGDGTCVIREDRTIRCWGDGSRGQLATGNIARFGDDPGEVASAAAAVALGGAAAGRDRDGDGVRDAADACPDAAGPAPGGCPPPTLSADTTPPIDVAISTPARLAPFQTAPTLTLGLRGRDPESGITGYSVTDRRGPITGLLRPPRVAVVTVAPAARIRLLQGATHCFGVTATNGAGRSTSSPERCTTLPLSAHRLVASAGWRTGTHPGHFAARARIGSRRGATLTLRGVVARRIAIVATRGPGMGRVSVWFAGRRLRTIDLRSARTARRQVIPVTTLVRTRRGTLTVRVESDARPVVIEGVGAGKV